MHQNSRARPSNRTFSGQLGAISAVTERRSEIRKVPDRHYSCEC
jgi:hypothetical protein